MVVAAGGLRAINGKLSAPIGKVYIGPALKKHEATELAALSAGAGGQMQGSRSREGPVAITHEVHVDPPALRWGVQ